MPRKSANFRLELPWVLATSVSWFPKLPGPTSSPLGCKNPTTWKSKVPQTYSSILFILSLLVHCTILVHSCSWYIPAVGTFHQMWSHITYLHASMNTLFLYDMWACVTQQFRYTLRQMFPVCVCATGTWLFCMSGNHGPCLHDIPTILWCSVVDYKSFNLYLLFLFYYFFYPIIRSNNIQ